MKWTDKCCMAFNFTSVLPSYTDVLSHISVKPNLISQYYNLCLSFSPCQCNIDTKLNVHVFILVTISQQLSYYRGSYQHESNFRPPCLFLYEWHTQLQLTHCENHKHLSWCVLDITNLLVLKKITKTSRVVENWRMFITAPSMVWNLFTFSNSVISSGFLLNTTVLYPFASITLLYLLYHNREVFQEKAAGLPLRSLFFRHVDPKLYKHI